MMSHFPIGFGGDHDVNMFYGLIDQTRLETLQLEVKVAYAIAYLKISESRG